MTKPNGTAAKAALGLACCLDAGLWKDRDVYALAFTDGESVPVSLTVKRESAS